MDINADLCISVINKTLSSFCNRRSLKMVNFIAWYVTKAIKPDLWRNKGKLQDLAPIKEIRQMKERYTQIHPWNPKEALIT